MVDAMVLVGYTVVEAVFGMADMAEPVPLAGALGVPVRELVVVARRSIVHRVLELRPAEQRRPRQLELEVEGEDGAAAHTGGAGLHPFGRQEVEAAEDVTLAPETPRGSRRCAGDDWQLVIGGKRFSHGGGRYAKPVPGAARWRQHRCAEGQDARRERTTRMTPGPPLAEGRTPGGPAAIAFVRHGWRTDASEDDH